MKRPRPRSRPGRQSAFCRKPMESSRRLVRRRHREHLPSRLRQRLPLRCRHLPNLLHRSRTGRPCRARVRPRLLRPRKRLAKRKLLQHLRRRRRLHQLHRPRPALARLSPSEPRSSQPDAACVPDCRARTAVGRRGAQENPLKFIQRKNPLRDLIRRRIKPFRVLPACPLSA